MNVRRYLDVQDAMVFVAAAFGWAAIRAGEPIAAGVAIGAVMVGLVISVLRIRLVGR